MVEFSSKFAPMMGVFLSFFSLQIVIDDDGDDDQDLKVKDFARTCKGSGMVELLYKINLYA